MRGIDENNQTQATLEFEFIPDDRGLVCLFKTSQITDEMVRNSPIWASIKKMYQRRDFISKAMASTLNACLTQNRIVFCFSSETLGVLISNDKNNQKRKTKEIKNETEYKNYIREMFNPKRDWFHCCLQSTKNVGKRVGNPFIAQLNFESIYSEIERALRLDKEVIFEQQFVEAKKYAQYNPILKNTKTDLSELFSTYLESKKKQGADKSKKDISRDNSLFVNFQAKLNRIVFEFVALVDGNADYIDRLVRDINILDNVIRANLEIAISDGLCRINLRKNKNKCDNIVDMGSK